MTGKFLFVAASVALATVLLLTLVDDLLLKLTGNQTISDWLRQHLVWYWRGAAVVTFFVVLLGVHLYFPGILGDKR